MMRKSLKSLTLTSGISQINGTNFGILQDFEVLTDLIVQKVGVKFSICLILKGLK